MNHYYRHLGTFKTEDEAHAAYLKAKEALSEDAAVGGLQLKIDDLAKGDA